MKRKILSILCLMLALVPCLTMVGCKKDKSEQLGGHFRATSVTVTTSAGSATTSVDQYDELVAKGDKTLDEEMQLAMVETFFQMNLWFYDDYSFIQSFDYDEEDIETVMGSYTLKGENLSISCEGETINCKYADGKITMTITDQDITITAIFEK